MKKTYWNIATKVINESSLVLIILDARMPFETRNVELERKIVKMGKNFIYVINKSDLVDNKVLKSKTKDLQPNVFVSSKFNIGLKQLREKMLESSVKRPLIVSVVGYPNTGKSSLINCLKQKRSAGVSPTSGFTKGMQKIKISQGIYLVDTPGVIPKSVKSESMRVITNIAGPEKIRYPDLAAMKIIEIFIKNNPKKLEEFYKIKIKKNSEKTLEVICKRLNHLKKGGELDMDRTARKIILDWQRGKLVLD